jgi:hypothetical protein
MFDFITLDTFAGQAMQALLSRVSELEWPDGTPESRAKFAKGLAERSYEIAGAMMDEREKIEALHDASLRHSRDRIVDLLEARGEELLGEGDNVDLTVCKEIANEAVAILTSKLPPDSGTGTLAGEREGEEVGV